MNEHEHRPSYFRFLTGTRGRYICKHCQKPLHCTNSWLLAVATLPIAALAVLLIAARGLQIWPMLLPLFALDFLLNYLAFRHLRFEVDFDAMRSNLNRPQ